MKALPCFSVIFVIIKAVESFEAFEEVAWMDKIGDKYFEYPDISYKFDERPKSESANLIVPNKIKQILSIPHRHISHQSSSVIDLFFNSVKKVFKPPPPLIVRAENETTKGLDIQFEDQHPLLQGAVMSSQDLQLIYLGTKWCGSGDIATSRNDVGYFYMTDACCRQHDACPQMLAAKQSNFGLVNTGRFTRSHCGCDNAFYKCLKSVNTLVSNQIGLLYFTILGPQCFQEDYPLKCVRSFRRRCVEYAARDKTQSKRYQWIDNKYY